MTKVVQHSNIPDRQLFLIGGPEPASVIEWLVGYALTNRAAAHEAFAFWDKIRYRARAKAFFEAADLVRRAAGLAELHTGEHLK